MELTPNRYQRIPAVGMVHTPTPLHHHVAVGMSPADCPCPTCLYYRACYFHPVASPEAFTPMPNVNLFGWPVAVTPPRGQHDSTQLEEYNKLVGEIASAACTSSGRTTLQAAMRSQDVEVVSTILKEIVADLETVCLDTHGCHVVRSLVELLDDEQLRCFMLSMNATLVLNMCTLSQYTRRILQAMFERHRIDLQPVVEVLASNAQYLSATQQGCISLIKIYQECSMPQKAMLMAPLLSMLPSLATDPYGNYVVQCAMEHSDKVTASRYVTENLRGSLLLMSCNKFASNVVEKIISCVNTPVTRRLLLDEVVYNPAALQQMVNDAFGNFVIQSVIETCVNSNEFKRICDRLRPTLAASPYGARIESRIRSKKLLQQPMKAPSYTTQQSPMISVAAF